MPWQRARRVKGVLCGDWGKLETRLNETSHPRRPPAQHHVHHPQVVQRGALWGAEPQVGPNCFLACHPGSKGVPVGPTSASASGMKANPEGWSRGRKGRGLAHPSPTTHFLLPFLFLFSPLLFLLLFLFLFPLPSSYVALADLELTEICLLLLGLKPLKSLFSVPFL